MRLHFGPIQNNLRHVSGGTDGHVQDFKPQVHCSVTSQYCKYCCVVYVHDTPHTMQDGLLRKTSRLSILGLKAVVVDSAKMEQSSQ